MTYECVDKERIARIGSYNPESHLGIQMKNLITIHFNILLLYVITYIKHKLYAKFWNFLALKAALSLALSPGEK
jgi:hypothetical protein